MQHVGPLPTKLRVARHLDKDVQVAGDAAHVGAGGAARGRRVALAADAQPHAVLDAAGDVDRQRLALAHHAVALARPALGAGRARAGHLEAAHHRVHARARPVARLAGRPLGALLQAAAGAGLAGHERERRDGLAGALGRLHEGYRHLHLDVLAL